MTKLDILFDDLMRAISLKAVAERTLEAAIGYKGLPDALFTNSNQPIEIEIKKMTEAMSAIKKRANAQVEYANANLSEAREELRKYTLEVEGLALNLIIAIEEDDSERTVNAYSKACAVLGRQPAAVIA
jgi:RNAse (barnase) inhibitor barstar